MQSFSIISKIKKLISPFKNALHICLMFLLKKIGRSYPEFILKIIPNRIIDSYLRNDLSTHHINSYLKTIVISAKSELYNRLTDQEKANYCISQWKTAKGIEWFEKDLADHKIEDIISDRKNLIDLLDICITKNQGHEVLCEIGTGDGRFLSFLETRYKEINKFIGIDLNERYIQRNKNHYSNKVKLNFVAGQVSDIFDQVLLAVDNSPLLLISVRTLTWFTQSEIERLFNLGKASKKDIVFAFSEQNEINLKTELTSKIRGDIFFHSHNYPYLLKKAGWCIHNTKIQYNSKLMNDYSITMLATNKPFDLSI